MGYKTVHWSEMTEGERDQSKEYERVIETPTGDRYAIIIRLEEGEE